MHVHALLDDEVKVLAGERYARKDELERGRSSHGTNPVSFFTVNREDFSIRDSPPPATTYEQKYCRRRRGQGRVAARVASEL